MNLESMNNMAAFALDISSQLHTFQSDRQVVEKVILRVYEALQPEITELSLLTLYESERFLQEEVNVAPGKMIRGTEIIPLYQVQDYLRPDGTPVVRYIGDSEVYVPLLFEEKLEGLLLLRMHGALPDPLIDSLKLLGKGIAAGIHYISFARKVKREQQVMQMANEVSRRLNSLIGLESLLNRFLELTVDQLAFDRATLFLFGDSGKSTGRALCAIKGKEPHEVPVETELPIFSDVPMPLESIRGFLVPVIAGTRHIGTLVVDNFITLVPVPQDIIHILSDLCRSIALSYENALLFSKLKEVAVKDELTGMFRTGYFFELAMERMRTCRKLALVTIDMDHFKQVNDCYGHPAGDRVISQAASVIKRFLSPGDIACRMGGDEFIVLFTDMAQTEVFKRVSDLLGDFSRYMFRIGENDPDISLSFSAGISFYPEDSRDFQQLLSKSDLALYLSKYRGRSCVSLASDVGADTPNRMR